VGRQVIGREDLYARHLSHALHPVVAQVSEPGRLAFEPDARLKLGVRRVLSGG
jgi:hypothetical protein